MVWALIASLAIVFSNGAAPLKIGVQAASEAAASAPQTPRTSLYDSDAERRLLEMANQARAKAGLAPLRADEGLSQAARTHAAAMAEQQQLSHKFAGEAALAQRLAADSTLHLDRSGENVAYAANAEQAQETLMKSPPHRENLLSPDYNVAGFGVVRSGNTLYVTQDFAHNLPMVSTQTAEETIAGKLNRARREFGLSPLQRMDGTNAQTTACSMAHANLLRVSTPQARYVLRYTSMTPENLPPGTDKATGDRDTRGFSVGSCYARTASYPNGVYWVVVLFF
jgi:uncharacterized protein YkwD